MEAHKKLFRLSDLALVVYRGKEIVGVKHSAISPWMVWDIEHVRWDRAVTKDAKAFDLLPLAGSVAN